MSVSLQNIRLPLTDFTLEVDVVLHGRVTVVFGPSGAGKTSLLEILAGLRRPQSGRIQIDDVTLLHVAKQMDVPSQQRRVGYVPQDLALFPHLSVKQNLLYGFRPGEVNSQITLEHVTHVLDIEGLLPRRIHSLSGGEKQRVAFARALLTSPRLLLLDEPLASLDGVLKERILNYLRRIRDEFAIPMLYVTHDRAEAQRLADEMLVLDQGKVRQSGPVLEIFNRPANPDVAAIVGMETMQPGRVVNTADGLATVEVGQSRLCALAPEGLPADVFVCIRGEEVILQRADAPGSSVRNRLPGRVVGLQSAGPLIRVELDAGFPLFALVTRQACNELGLREGENVFALIKAPSVHLMPRSDRQG